MKRRALGKGLGSLLPERPAGGHDRQLLSLDLDRIVPNPNQPRGSFNQEELDELAASIGQAGVLQPILVRDAGAGYELVAGERRWRAAQLAGLKQIPAILQKVDGIRSLELALIENIQRQQLNPIDEARAFSRLISAHGLTQEQIAGRVGQKRSSIANRLRLLNLPQPVQEMLQDGRLTAGHAKALLALADKEEILKAAEAMLQGYVTVRGAEEMARKRKPVGKPPAPGVIDPNVRHAEERLQRSLGTKVRIKLESGGKRGRIEIDFYSKEDLDRLFETLEGPGRGH